MASKDPHSKEKYCVAINLGGISNRVKCLISMWRLADFYDRELLLEWHKNHTCGCNFQDLFKNKIKEISLTDLKKLKNKDIKFFGKNPITIFDVKQKYLVSGSERLILTPKEFANHHKLRAKGLDFNFSNIPIEIKKEICSYIEKLVPIEILQGEVDIFSEKYNLSKMIGIHIRRGDFSDKSISPGRVSSNEKFIERMNELIRDNPKISFFLCTDSKEIEEKMEKEFPAKIIRFQKTNFERTDVRATQEGLIDLILLSKTKHILGTYQSTFTEMAWWFGKCKPKMEIIIDKKKQKEYFENVRKERRRILPKIKRVILRLIGRKFI